MLVESFPYTMPCLWKQNLNHAAPGLKTDQELGTQNRSCKNSYIPPPLPDSSIQLQYYMYTQDGNAIIINHDLLLPPFLNYAS